VLYGQLLAVDITPKLRQRREARRAKVGIDGFGLGSKKNDACVYYAGKHT
jgi:hypothetical protein